MSVSGDPTLAKTVYSVQYLWNLSSSTTLSRHCQTAIRVVSGNRELLDSSA